MKMNKLIFPLMIALATMLATTGCKKGINKVTPLPGANQTGITDPNNQNTLPPGNQMDLGPGPGMSSGPGTLATSGSWDPANTVQDRAALAAYTVHFAYDSAAVLSKEESKLVIVSESLKSDPNVKLLIEGHCDERGTEEYNRSLGERRALAAREALANAGISADRVATRSYGEDRAADPGHTPAAWSKNRRDEFVLLHPK